MEEERKQEEVVVDVEDTQSSGSSNNNNHTNTPEGEHKEEEEESESGCCSRFRKKKKGKKEKTPPPRTIPWYTLYREYRPLNRPLLFIGFLAAAMNGAVFPVFSIVFGGMFQSYSEPESERDRLIRDYTLGFLGLGIFSFILFYVQTSITSMSGEEICMKIRLRAFESIMYNDVAFIDRHTSGAITSRMSSDVALVQTGVSEKVALYMMNMFQAFVGIIVAFVYGWKMTLVLLSVTPLLGIAFGLFAKLMTGSSLEGQDQYTHAHSIAAEAIQGFRTVVSFVREQYTIERYSERLKNSYLEGRRRSHFIGLAMGFVYLVMFGTYALGFWYGSTLVKSGEMDQGDVLVVFFSIIMAAMGLGNAGSIVPDLAKGSVAAGVLYNLIEEAPKIDRNPGGTIPDENFPGSIEFSGISFSYPSRPNALVLRDINFEVSKGSVIAFVGQSGGGKSTILQLLLRFYDPDGGSMRVNGVEVKDYDLEKYREEVGLVSQEPILFEGTIRENIRYGRLTATDEEIIEAAKMGNAHDFITRLPSGYDTQVGEKGSHLSGGQKQRVAIARAILKDPRILLLDEATSALDAESEELVQEALDRLMKSRTTIVIAHRLSTIRSADCIYVLDEGKVVEKGTHDELVKRKRFYYALVHKQVAANSEEGEKGSDERGEEGEGEGGGEGGELGRPFPLRKRTTIQTLRDEMRSAEREGRDDEIVID